METNKNKCITAVIVGAGHRAILYAEYALHNPEKLKIVGVVDPNPTRRKFVAKAHNLAKESCYSSIDELLSHPKVADAVINGTMDNLHIQTTIPLLKAGYDVLLEKPIGVGREEVLELLSVAKSAGRTIQICHVLRHAPFYAAIRERVANGDIGDILSVSTQENVSYHHMAVSFVRGKWNNSDICNSTMLMAKSCHDLDLITWMKSGIKPKFVSSFGNRMYFREDKAPEGAGTRCLVDCKIEKTCPYSCYKNYIEQGLWAHYVWDTIEDQGNDILGKDIPIEKKIESLKSEQNPHGRCVWHCDNNVVDHQVVAVEFEDGSTATHSLTGNTSKPCRYMKLIGTKGEIEGVMEDGYFVIRHPDARKGHEYSEEKITIDVTHEMHGGGDLHLVEDFVNVLQGNKPSISTTSLEDSINGHLIGFAANESNDFRKVVMC